MVRKSIASRNTNSPDLEKRSRAELPPAARPFSFRVLCLLFIHVVLFRLTFGLAFTLRFDFAVPPAQADVFWIGLCWFLGVKSAIFYFCGQYHGPWRHVSFSGLAFSICACMLSLFVLAAIDHFVLDFRIPRSILLIDHGLTLAIVVGSRSAWRFH